jgi:hypothetical protein
MGRYEELELERAVHLQIIADLKAQLQQVATFIPIASKFQPVVTCF